MHALITNGNYNLTPAVGEQNPRRVGKLSLTQLSELRHRGAFSTVSITFTACCVACAKSSVPEITEEPKTWYQEALACMIQSASSLTRRSAGIPAMITGLLAAYTTESFFDDVVLDLQSIADAPLCNHGNAESAQLPQVHALNCLKDIFTDARFATRIEGHMADTLDIAASCLESHM